MAFTTTNRFNRFFWGFGSIFFPFIWLFALHRYLYGDGCASLRNFVVCGHYAGVMVCVMFFFCMSFPYYYFTKTKKQMDLEDGFSKSLFIDDLLLRKSKGSFVSLKNEAVFGEIAALIKKYGQSLSQLLVTFVDKNESKILSSINEEEGTKVFDMFKDVFLTTLCEHLNSSPENYLILEDRRYIYKGSNTNIKLVTYAVAGSSEGYEQYLIVSGSKTLLEMNDIFDEVMSFPANIIHLCKYSVAGKDIYQKYEDFVFHSKKNVQSILVPNLYESRTFAMLKVVT